MSGDERESEIDRLVELLALAGIDVEVARCDPEALRLTAWDLLALAAMLEAPHAQAASHDLPVRDALAAAGTAVSARGAVKRVDMRLSEARHATGVEPRPCGCRGAM